jgi:hypothetical protein
VPCRLAASAILNSPDNTASTTRIRSSTGNCECPRRLISQSSQPASKSDPAKKLDSVDAQSIEHTFDLPGRRSMTAAPSLSAANGADSMSPLLDSRCAGTCSTHRTNSRKLLDYQNLCNIAAC